VITMRSFVNLFLLLCLVSFSCTGKTKEVAKANPTDKILLPDRVEIYNPLLGDSLVNPLLKNTGYKIYTLIDASCSACMAKIEEWSAFEAGLKNYNNVSLIPICYTKDKFELI